MRSFPGAGPVFEYEWLTNSRRWQLYATRALFVSALLVALWVAWRDMPRWAPASNRNQAYVAMRVYYAIVGTQLVLVLLAAPAATAGSVCIDKARGTLAHVLVTDLTDSEIVLGKLAARLTPVLTLIACVLPFAYLCTLLGGIDPDALAGAFAVTAGVAVLGCSLALTLSIWARKTHEVLLATYLVWSVWLLAGPIARQVNWILGAGFMVPGWVARVDPFDLAFAAYSRPASTSTPWDVATFVAGCLLLSAALMTLAVSQVRRVAARGGDRRGCPGKVGWVWQRHLGPDWRAVIDRLPGPSLDANPVLWREWYRDRPSSWSRRVWTLYVAGCVVFSLLAFVQCAGANAGAMGWRTALWVNGFQVAVGILLLSVGASTSLAEERARGSLDVLMTTPLSTRSIVWGKWLGAFRTVPLLAVLPTFLAATLAYRSGRWGDVAFLVVLVFAYGAFITSLGLALATWIPRLGRAVALCVAADVLITVGLFFVIFFFIRGPQGEHALAVSPFGGPAILTAVASGYGPPRPNDWPADPYLNFVFAHGWEITAAVAYLAGAAALAVVTLLTFDRCLGRAKERSLPVSDLWPYAKGPAYAGKVTEAADDLA